MPKLTFSDQLNEEQRQYARMIGEKAVEMGIPPELAISIAYHESRLNPNAPRGSSGEFGIMQVMPATGKGMGFTNKDLADPNKNIEAGLKYLKQNLDAFGGDAKLATIGYNAGTDSPFFSGGKLPETTENYLKSMKDYGAYSGEVVAQPTENVSAVESAAPSAAAESVTENVETDKQRDARIQAAMDEQEKRQAQILGGGVGLGISGTKAAGSGAGALIQAAANRAGQGFNAGMQANAPPVSPVGQPSAGPTSGEKWAAKTGYGKGAGTVQDVSSRYQRSMGQGKISGRMDKLWGPALDGESQQLAQRLIDRSKPVTPPKVSGLEYVGNMFQNMMRPVTAAVSTVGKYVFPPLALASAAGEGVNIAQQARRPEDQRDTTGMALSGANILGAGLSMIPRFTPIGIPLTIGTAASQAYRDSPEAQAYVQKKIQGLADTPLLEEMTGPLP